MDSTKNFLFHDYDLWLHWQVKIRTTEVPHVQLCDEFDKLGCQNLMPIRLRAALLSALSKYNSKSKDLYSVSLIQKIHRTWTRTRRSWSCKLWTKFITLTSTSMLPGTETELLKCRSSFPFVPIVSCHSVCLYTSIIYRSTTSVPFKKVYT